MRLLVFTIALFQCMAYTQTQDTMPSEDLIPFADDTGKWGYLDAETLEIEIIPKYNSAYLFEEGVAKVTISNPQSKDRNDRELIGWIDRQGKEIFSPKFRGVYDVKTRGDRLLPNLKIVYTNDGKKGILNLDGTWLFELGTVDDVTFYDADVYLIDNKTFYSKGKTYSTPKGCTITYIDFDNRLFEIQKNNELQNGICTWEGIIIVPPKHLNVEAFPKINRYFGIDAEGGNSKKNLIRIYNTQNYDDIKASTTVYNENGEAVTTVVSRYNPSIINDSVASYENNNQINYFSLKTGEKVSKENVIKQEGNRLFKEGYLVGVKSEEDEILIPAKYSNIEGAGKTYVIAKNPNTYKYGILNYNGETILPFNYGNITYYNDSLIIASKDDKYGLIDINGTVNMDFTYDREFYFDEHDLARVSKDYKDGIINKSGKEVIPAIYTSLYNTKQLDDTEIIYYTAEKDSLWGLLSETGETIISFKYGLVSIQDYEFEYGWIRIEDKDRNHHGLFHLKNGTIIPAEYDYITPYKDFLITTKRLDNKDSSQMLSTKGEPLTEPDYSNMDYEQNTYIVAEKDNKYGILDTDGTILIPFEYDYFFSRTPNILLANQDGKRFYINIDGTKYLPR